MDETALSLGTIDVSYLSTSAECSISRCKHSSEEWGECNSRPTLFRSATLKWKETLLGRKRPFVGRCCYACTPQSRDNFFNASIPSLGLRNVIYINETHTRYRGWLARRFCYVLFVQERDVHKGMFAKNLTENVLNNSRVQKAIVDEASEPSTPGSFVQADPKAINKVKKKARKILQEMVANVSPALIRLTGWVLLKLFNSFFWNIQIHRGQIEMVKAATEMNLPLIFLPVHKSHIDYLLLTFILFCHNIKAPYIAAGNNLNIPIFSTLIRKLGGFFIRRKLDQSPDGRKDFLYRALLYVGKPKKNESIWSIARGVFRMLRKNYGCVRVDFAQPFSLKEYVNSQSQKPVPAPLSLEQALLPAILPSRPNDTVDEGAEASLPNSRDITSEPFRRELISNLAEHILFTANKSCAVMSTHIVACLLLYRHRQGTDLSRLVEDFFSMKEEVLARDFDLGFSGNSDDVVMHAIHLLGNCVNITNTSRNNEFFITPSTTIPAVFELNFYSNGVLHVFIKEAIIACSLHAVQSRRYRNGTNGASPSLISQEHLVRKAASLCYLLSNEFTVSLPCQLIYQVCHESVERLIQYGILLVAEQDDQEDVSPSLTEHQWNKKLPEPLSWRSDEEDEDSDFGEEQRDCYLKVSQSQEHQQYITFLQRLLGPLLEAYSSVVIFVHNFSGPVLESEYLQKLHRHLISRTEKNVAVYAESATYSHVKNALKVFKEIGVFSQTPQRRDTILELSTTFLPQRNRQKLLEFIMSFMVL
uniref:Glycerol-3-phosphate acyltransferase 1, mitochondrial n=1 Tax=Amazona collaria TaxID=241587 RepID=A0A8B9IT06_9PSIT